MEKKDIKDILKTKSEQLRKLPGRWTMNEENLDKSRNRDDYQRDYGRVLYSSAFRRLQGKMQLLGINSSRYYRNRLTHSLEVAQIARSVCTTLSKKYDGLFFWTQSDLFVIETICLSHDLGNPPFGHAGEVKLNQIASEFGGFEGNAQTFRILSELERKFPDICGLNLTNRTMLGVVKYCQVKKDNEKFLYENDYKKVVEIKTKHGILDSKTLDCQVMDLADEIAYGAHDLEDSLHQRFIAPYDLIYLFKREKEVKKVLKDYTDDDIQLSIDTLGKLVNESLNYAYKCSAGDSDDLFETVLRKELCSKIVNLLVLDIDYDVKGDKLKFIKYECLVVGLKKLLFNAIKNDSEQILMYERIGNKVLAKLYEVYIDDKYNKDNALLSSTYRIFYNDPNEKKRRVVDYISGMMDQYAYEVYEKITGERAEKGII